MSNINPYQQQQYVAPGMQQDMNTALFYRPQDSKLPQGDALYSFLTQDAAVNPASVTNRTVKYDGGLTREMMGNGFGQLSGQIGNGFTNQLTGIEDLFNQYGSLGGLGGIASAGNNSAVYRPQGQMMTANGQQQGANGAQPTTAFGATNPFNATF